MSGWLSRASNLLVGPCQLACTTLDRQFRPDLRSSIVPVLHARPHGRTNTRTVSRIPAHLIEATGFGMMTQDRRRFGRLYADAFVATRVSVDVEKTEGFVCAEVLLQQLSGAGEAVDEG